MISLQFLLVALVFGVSVGDPTGTITPCKKSDKACIKSSAKSALSKFLGDFPELGVDSSDPLSIDEIVGNLSTMKFKFTNITAVGLKNCDINNTNLNLNSSKLMFDLICSDLIMSGHYNTSGQVLNLPATGDGPYSIHCKKYMFLLDADLKQVKGSDGQQHLAVKNYIFKSDVLEPITLDFKNLFNGQKDLAKRVLKFANQYWKEVADFFKEPLVTPLLKKVVKNFNKFLKLVSVNEFYLDN